MDGLQKFQRHASNSDKRQTKSEDKLKDQRHGKR